MNQSSKGIENVNRNISEGVSVIGEINSDIASVNASSSLLASLFWKVQLASYILCTFYPISGMEVGIIYTVCSGCMIKPIDF